MTGIDNSLDDLTQVTGVTRDQLNSIWEQVKANAATLKACPKHRFENVPVVFGKRVTCLACGGEMDVVAISNYIRGYEAAGGDANDIWPDHHKERGA